VVQRGPFSNNPAQAGGSIRGSKFGTVASSDWVPRFDHSATSNVRDANLCDAQQPRLDFSVRRTNGTSVSLRLRRCECPSHSGSSLRPIPLSHRSGWKPVRSPSDEHNNQLPLQFRRKLPTHFYECSVMKRLTWVGIFLLLTATSWAQCSFTSRTHGNLQWSELAKIIAPDGSWVVEVHPVLDADENRTPVTLHKCGESKSLPLFTLQRSAELYWSSDSKHVLVVNQPLSGTNKVLLFSVPRSATDTQEVPSDALDRTVNNVIVERLGKNKHIQFYLPTFGSWKDSSLLLAVGGETYAENVGPLDTYCYGLRINSDTLRVENVLAEKELKASTGHGCKTSP